jgi:fucose permease
MSIEESETQPLISIAPANDTTITSPCQAELLTLAIDHIGFGKYQYLLFLLCGLGWACDSAFTQVIGVIFPQVQREFNLTDFEASYLQVCLKIGVMSG